jgi:hypothetical protein
VDLDACPPESTACLRDQDVRDARKFPTVGDPPERRCGLMTEASLWLAREQRSRCARQGRLARNRPDGINGSMKGEEPAAREHPLRGGSADRDREELGTRDHPMLMRGDRGDPALTGLA